MCDIHSRLIHFLASPFSYYVQGAIDLVNKALPSEAKGRWMTLGHVSSISFSPLYTLILLLPSSFVAIYLQKWSLLFFLTGLTILCSISQFHSSPSISLTELGVQAAQGGGCECLLRAHALSHGT